MFSVLKFFIMTSSVSTILSSMLVNTSSPFEFMIEYISRTWEGPSPKFVNSVIVERSAGL